MPQSKNEKFGCLHVQNMTIEKTYKYRSSEKKIPDSQEICSSTSWIRQIANVKEKIKVSQTSKTSRHSILRYSCLNQNFYQLLPVHYNIEYHLATAYI